MTHNLVYSVQDLQGDIRCVHSVVTNHDVKACLSKNHDVCGQIKVNFSDRSITANEIFPTMIS